MANENKVTAVRPDGVADFNCCMSSRSRRYEGDALDVDIALGNDGVADIHIAGCRHVHALIDSRAGGFCHKIRVGEKVFVLIAATEDSLLDVMAGRHREALERGEIDRGKTTTSSPPSDMQPDRHRRC